jgi:hypothetical protein
MGNNRKAGSHGRLLTTEKHSVVRVSLHQCRVEGGQQSVVVRSQGGQVGVGDFPVSTQVGQVDVAVGQIVGPEQAPGRACTPLITALAVAADSPSRSRNLTSAPSTTGHIANWSMSRIHTLARS